MIVVCSSCIKLQNGVFLDKNFTYPLEKMCKGARSFQLKAAVWENLPGWKEDPLLDALMAFQQQCVVLSKSPLWDKLCQCSQELDAFDIPAIRLFFETKFSLFQLSDCYDRFAGLITGYYEPILRGSLKKEGKFIYPIYHWPKNVARGSMLPERHTLLTSGILRGNEIVYLDDPIDAFFLQIQGSGCVILQNGRVLRIGFDGSNGHPYRSIGEWLIKKNAINVGQATRAGIKTWIQKNPQQLFDVLAINPRYVFFRIISNVMSPTSPLISDSILPGPIGALGVPLTATRSVAVDPTIIPLGTPIFLSTWNTLNKNTINRLVFAQDTGSEIRGAVRADYFFGCGSNAGIKAERMKQMGKMWVLMPK